MSHSRMLVVGALALALVPYAGCGGKKSSGGDPVCGNGVVEQGEACDGADLGGEDCASLGLEGGDLACTDTCEVDTSSCTGTALCGDGVRSHPEECDATDLAGSSCADLGFDSGTLSCTAACTFDTDQCEVTGVCGDGEATPDEQCDGDDLAGATCASLGLDSGSLACTAGCTFDTNGCAGTNDCGNDAIEFPEQCDGQDLAGRTCQTLGHGGGVLTCATDCTFDESGCTDDLCGNDVVDATEQCDGPDLAGQTCQTRGYDTGTLTCAAGCTFDESGCDLCAAIQPVSDPGFGATTDWSGTGTAVVDPTAAGYSDAGEGQIPDTAACDLDVLSQTITLPSMDDCGPARLVGWVDILGVGGPGTGLGTYVNGNWREISVALGSGWEDFSHCLGEAAFDGAVDLRLGASAPSMGCPGSAQGLRVDNVEVVWDPLCPGIGEVKNGDLEAGNGEGWTLESNATGTAEADVAGVGVGGSVGARMAINALCDNAAMWAPMSVPTTATLASPALTVQANLTAGEEAWLWIDHVTDVPLVGTGAFDTVQICLPPHAAGGVWDVGFDMQTWGTCGTPVGPWTLVVDDLAVVSDPMCLFADGLLDPGVEASVSDARRFGWVLSANATSFGGSPVSEVSNSPADAHAGSGSIHLSVDQRCDLATVNQWFAIPAPTATEGPALAFWYRYPAPVDTYIAAYVDSVGMMSSRLGELLTVPAAATYTRAVMCLDPSMAGRPAVLGISLSAAGACADFLGAVEEIWLDDFEATTDPSCPTQ